MRPCMRTAPSVGRRIPAITLSSVVLPLPLWPIRPSDSPSRTSKATSRSAQKSSARERELIRRALRLEGFSRNRRKRFETWSISIAAVIGSQLLREVAGETEAEAPGGGQQQERADEPREQHRGEPRERDVRQHELTDGIGPVPRRG